MNTYIFQQIEIGMTEQFSVLITEKMMKNFCELTGDCNPLHTDESFAKEMGYKKTVVYGMLSASMFSTLAGMLLPGKYSLINNVDIAFAKPVYVGDNLRVIGQVVEKNEKYHFITLKLSIYNQESEKVCRGKMEVGVKK